MLKDSPVTAFLNKMADLLILNFLFLLCSVPIITIGPAMTAMYHVSLRSIRYGDGYVVKEFFKAFRKNFVDTTIAWIGSSAFAALFLVDIYFWSQNNLGILSRVMIIISSCFGFFAFITIVWLFPVIAKIENTLLGNLKNAFAMAVGHFFPYTIVCVGIITVVGYFAYTSLAADVVMLLIGFALLSYVLSFFFYKTFALYMSEEPVGEEDPLYGSKSKE